MRSLAILTLCLALAPAAFADRDRHGDERRERHESKEDRRYWKEREKEEHRYWKERDREAREHDRHRYWRHDDDARRGLRPLAPPWMGSYWRPGDQRRYVALVPGDPTRMYVFLDGRWVLRRVTDPRARLDLEGAYGLPVVAPPIPPPRLGLNLHIVLFN